MLRFPHDTMYDPLAASLLSFDAARQWIAIALHRVCKSHHLRAGYNLTKKTEINLLRAWLSRIIAVHEISILYVIIQRSRKSGGKRLAEWYLPPLTKLIIDLFWTTEIGFLNEIPFIVKKLLNFSIRLIMSNKCTSWKSFFRE